MAHGNARLFPLRIFWRARKSLCTNIFAEQSPQIRKLEKAVAVRNSLLEKFSGKFRRCWKIPHRFSGSAKCYPCQGLGTFRQGKRLLENWPRLRERCWIFSSETATAFLSSSDQNLKSVCLYMRRSSLRLSSRPHFRRAEHRNVEGA